MSKIAVLILIFALVQCLHSKLLFREPVKNWYRQQQLVGVKSSDYVSYTSAEYVGYNMPPDNGKNFGDLIHKRRVTNDVLVTREIIINEDIFSQDVEFEYNNRFTGQNITTVRAVNIGRERAYVQTVSSSDHGLVLVKGLIGKNQQIRLLIEAYGIPL